MLICEGNEGTGDCRTTTMLFVPSLDESLEALVTELSSFFDFFVVGRGVPSLL